MERIIKQVHFQLTRNCNLRCSFCGQWGKKGFFADSAGCEMTLNDWNRIINELEGYREKTGISPVITLWGGEPLVSPYFDEIARTLKQKGFKTELITNGTKIDEHKDVIENCIDRLYVSIDGPLKLHDSIRGAGVYSRVTENLRRLNHSDIVVMTVVTKELKGVLDKFLSDLDGLGIRELFLQDMIGLSASEIKEYKAWMKQVFGIAAKDIDSWEDNDLFIEGSLETGEHSYQIVRKAHTKEGVCRSPFSHTHITWCGDVMYCTDHYDFSAGNVKTDTLENIFLNEKSERFRQEIEKGNCATCNHCSWRLN